MRTTLAYGDSVRTLQVDMIAFDEADQTIRAYEVKRGKGQFDTGKIRSVKRDLRAGAPEKLWRACEVEPSRS